MFRTTASVPVWRTKTRAIWSNDQIGRAKTQKRQKQKYVSKLERIKTTRDKRNERSNVKNRVKWISSNDLRGS